MCSGLSCQLGSDVHKGNAILVNCSAGDVPAGVQTCCPCHHWPVGRHEGVHRCAELPEKLLWDRDKGAMICEHRHQHLLGHLGSAKKAQPEARPAGDAGMQPLEGVCVEGVCCSTGVRTERNAKMSDAVPAALKVMPVAWSGPNRCCRQPIPMSLDLLRCSLAPVASVCRAMLPSKMACPSAGVLACTVVSSAWRCRNGEGWPSRRLRPCRPCCVASCLA